jgi:hypothetical protein
MVGKALGRVRRPARAEMIGDPSDDRCTDRRTTQRDTEPQRHHASAHRGLGRELHQRVRGVGDGQRGDADPDERGSEQPVARRERSQRAPQSED